MGRPTPEILTNVQKIYRDPNIKNINFPGNAKFQDPKILGKFPVPTSREETVHCRHYGT